jgi:hypothetical protein
MKGRALLWVGVTGLLVLVARSLCYALAPDPLANRFEASTGGPGLVLVALVSLALAAAVSSAVLWLAIVGVRERQRLRPERELPSVRLRRLAVRATVLSAAGSLGFALLESSLHWKAGLGFHWLSCLLGPVHVNALPLIAALALLAAALAEAIQHLHAWMRATVQELLRPRLGLVVSSALGSAPPAGISSALLPFPARSRAPPLPA